MNNNNRIPLLSKYNFYKLVNPLARIFFTWFSPKKLVTKIINRLEIDHLNLGGYRPTEGYLSIQLSPVHPYGIPTICSNTTVLHYNETTGEVSQENRVLAKPAPSLHFDILKGIPLDSSSLSGINMSHIFEHFTRDDGSKLLRECYRLLKPGGVVRISCPDLFLYAKAYVNHDISFFDSIAIRKACMYEGLTTYGDLFISKAYDNENGHKWFYDAESVINLLNEVGFTKAEQRNLHESSLPYIENVEPSFRQSETFYVEATK